MKTLILSLNNFITNIIFFLECRGKSRIYFTSAYIILKLCLRDPKIIFFRLFFVENKFQAHNRRNPNLAHICIPRTSSASPHSAVQNGPSSRCKTSKPYSTHQRKENRNCIVGVRE